MNTYSCRTCYDVYVYILYFRKLKKKPVLFYFHRIFDSIIFLFICFFLSVFSLFRILCVRIVFDLDAGAYKTFHKIDSLNSRIFRYRSRKTNFSWRFFIRILFYVCAGKVYYIYCSDAFFIQFCLSSIFLSFVQL